MPKKTDKANPSERILNTAFECLSTRGYANVSIRNIADDAGVALSQVAYYYGNKEKLFLEVIDMMMIQYIREVEEKLESAVDEKQKFAALIGFFKGLIQDNPKLLKLFIDFTAQALWVPSFREHLDNMLHRLTELIEGSLVNEAIPDSRYAGYSPRSIAKLIQGALFGTAMQIMLSSDRDNSLESLVLAESLLN